jgi:hypothetical protein
MTPIELMALIVLVVGAVKLIVLVISPKSWIGVMKQVWSNSVLAMIVCIILAAIVLYTLVNNGIGIVQIFAVILFIVLLAGIGVSAYAKEITDFAIKLLKGKNILKKSWICILIWALLIIWGLKELFF